MKKSLLAGCQVIVLGLLSLVLFIGTAIELYEAEDGSAELRRKKYDYRFRIVNENAKDFLYVVEQDEDVYTSSGFAAYVRIKAGEFKVTASSKGYRKQTLTLTAPLAEEDLVTNEEGISEYLIELQKSSATEPEVSPLKTLTVSVKGPPDSAPARVALSGPGTWETKWTNQASFDLEHEGEYSVRVDGLRFHSYSGKVVIPKNKAIEVSLRRTADYDKWASKLSKHDLRLLTRQHFHLPGPAPSKPSFSYTVSRTELGLGMRVQIDVTGRVSKSEAKRLIEDNERQANLPYGQVVLRKRSDTGEWLPWAVKNSVDEGIFFNDFYF